MEIKMELARWHAGESDADLVAATLERYAIDTWLVQGRVLADQIGAGGNAVVLWTGDADELAKLQAAYNAEAEPDNYYVAKALPVGTPVRVTNTQTGEVTDGTVVSNDFVYLKTGILRGWYIIRDAAGREHEALALITIKFPQ